MNATAAEPVVVAFGVRRSRAVLFGQSGPQLVAEAAGFVAVVAALRGGSLPATAGWVAVAAVCAVLAWAPVRGRRVVEYLPAYVGWWVRLAFGQHLYLGGVYRMGEHEQVLGGPRLPGELADLDWQTYHVADGAEPVAVLKDRRSGTYTAVLALRSAAFCLLEVAEQHRRVQAYGAMLDALCRPDSPLCRLQILERTIPESGAALRHALAAHGDPAATAAVRAAYEQLIAAPAVAGQRHETYLAITLDPRRGAAAQRIAAHGGGDLGAAAVLFATLTQISAGLAAAAVEVTGWLPPRGLAYALRTAFDPAAAPMLDRRGGGAGDPAGGETGLPSGTDPRVAAMFGQAAHSYYRTDSAFHRTYWVLEWPRVDVPAGFLQPLLLNGAHRRTLSLIMEPVPPHQAQRAIDIAEAHQQGERAWRRKIGRRERHRDHAEAEATERRERELTAGYGTYRLHGLITVTAATLPELDQACGEVLSLASQSRLETALLVHQQDQAFYAGALPLARGL